MGRAPRTSTKRRSLALVVRSLRHKGRGKSKKDSGRSARPLRIFARRICCDARAHSSAHQRIGEGNAFDDYASVEATRVAAVAAQTACAYKRTHTSFPNFGSFIADVQAAAPLRLQCVESEEVRRETSVCAYESP